MKNTIEDALEPTRFSEEYKSYFNQEAEIVRDNINGYVLDIGCGNCRILPFIYDRCQGYLGIDNNKRMIERAQSLINYYPNAKTLLIDAKDLARYFTQNEFDVSICLWNTLHLMGKEEHALKNIFEITRNKVIITLAAKNDRSFVARKNYYSSFRIEHSIDEKTETIFSKIWGDSKAYTLSDVEILSKETGFPLIKKGVIGDLGIYGIFKKR